MRHLKLLGALTFGALSPCALLGLTACADIGALRAEDTGPPPSFGDAAVAGPDAGAPAPRSEASFGDDNGRSACLDFVDNNEDGVLDCDETECQSRLANPSCCVGSTAEACCTAEEISVVTTCASGSCLEVAGESLSSAHGQIFAAADLPGGCTAATAAAYAPIGTAVTHDWMALPASQDLDLLSARVEVSARLGMGASTPRGEVAAAGFGVFTEQGLGAMARPLVGVVTSVTSNDLRVIVGDRVVTTIDLPDGACARDSAVQLSLTPDGRFTVHRRDPGVSGSGWGEPVASGSFDAVPHARIAMFGQQPNPDAQPAAWVSELAVTVNGCDRLAPARAAAPTVRAAGAHDVTGIAVFPSSVGASTHDALVTSDDQIYWMSVQAGSGGLVSTVSSDPFADNIQPSWHDYRHFEDIEVVVHGGVHQVFLAAARGDDGVFEIVSTEYTPSTTAGMPGTLGTPAVVLTAAQLSRMGATAVSVDGPSVAWVSAEASLVMAVRVRFEDGHSEIRIAPAESLLATEADFASPNVQGRDASGVTTDGLVHANQATRLDAFDRDEVADPQIVETDGVVRVLFAGRRGTRWALGSIVASPDFQFFIPVSNTPFLEPSGAGFDALGVSEPQLVRRGGIDWLYFAGSDGARRGIGLAVQPVVQGTAS
ncbi:MAG: hypothetical protein U0353_05965 [Sandaracinus sp.]